ncbi:UNVERIFIED_CONTAM: hypothetical protein Cloal_2187 [Acetivibrio alkalicellulosi]
MNTSNNESKIDNEKEKNKSNILNFVKDIDNEDIVIIDEKLSNDSSVLKNIFKEYEKVIVRSIITSFGLDILLIQDRRGGDVDTINTVRDNSVKGYANINNQIKYENRGEYNSDSYHKHKNYINTNKENSIKKRVGNLTDAYTGKTIATNDRYDLDHTISAKEIHNDPGRVLAGLSGVDLANRSTNLNATDRSINRSKKAKSSDDFLKKLNDENETRKDRINELNQKEYLTSKEQKEFNKLEKLESIDSKELKEKDIEARNSYEKEIARTYYTSQSFLKQTVKASLEKGYKMGFRQCLGLLLTEVWFSIKEDFPKIVSEMKEKFELSLFFNKIIGVIKKAFDNVSLKYKELIEQFKNGALAGILASISSTVINIFFTTVKFVARVLRESWATIVEAIKILVFNPDNLPFGEMLKAVSKIIATCVSVICGSLVQEAISKMNPVKLPIISDVLPSFIGSLVTGIMSVSMLYYIDNSEIVKKIVAFSNQLKNEFDYKLDYFKKINEKLTDYVSDLASIDYDMLEQEINYLRKLNKKICLTETIEDLNYLLHKALIERNIKLPYTSLDDFMNDKHSVLII